MTVHYEVEGRVATVRIDRPEVFNALNRATLEGIRDSFRKASADHHVGVVVLTGTGDRAFSTGADLDEQEAFLARPNDYWDWMGRFIEAIEAIKDCAKPVVARLNGMVVGGGNELNIACDLAIAADDVVFRHVGPTRGSLPAGGATQWMPLLVGDRRAREVLLLNRPFLPPRRSTGAGSIASCRAPSSMRPWPTTATSCSARCPRSSVPRASSSTSGRTCRGR